MHVLYTYIYTQYIALLHRKVIYFFIVGVLLILLCIYGSCENGTTTSLSSLFASSYAICILCKRPIFKTEVLLPEVRQASS